MVSELFVFGFTVWTWLKCNKFKPSKELTKVGKIVETKLLMKRKEAAQKQCSDQKKKKITNVSINVRFTINTFLPNKENLETERTGSAVPEESKLGQPI